MKSHKKFILELIQQRSNPLKLFLNDLIDDDILDAIFKESNTDIIQNLGLVSNSITHQGVINFSRHQWSNLKILVFTDNRIGDKGCKYISKASLPKLQTLCLNNNQIGCAGLLHLSKIQPKIIQRFQISNFILMLEGNYFQAEGIKFFVKGSWNKQIAKIVLQRDITSIASNRCPQNFEIWPSCKFILIGILVHNEGGKSKIIFFSKIRQYQSDMINYWN